MNDIEVYMDGKGFTAEDDFNVAIDYVIKELGD